jgi:hypothetical protein
MEKNAPFLKDITVVIYVQNMKTNNKQAHSTSRKSQLSPFALSPCCLPSMGLLPL